MSDFVYKQMIDKVTNLPIQGGIFFLRDVEGVREDVPLVELPDDGTGSTQGRYVSETEVNNGVYAVYRTIGVVSTVTGDEVHVEAGRVTHGEVDDAPLTPVTSRLLGGVVYALGFLPDGQADDADIPSAYLTEALAYAAANGIHKVVVGSYKGRDTWIGSTTIEIPEGVTDLQLDGATVFCTVANLPIFQYVGTSTLEISSGELKAAGAGSAAHVVSAAPITYRNVYFSGNSQTLGFTTQTIAGQPTDWVTYVGCRNVRVDTGMRYLPALLNGGNLVGSCKQAAFGGSIDTFDTGAVPPIETKSILYSTLDGLALDQVILEPRKPMSPAPAHTGGGPFTSSVDAMKAVKTLWFTDKPKAETVYANGEVCDTSFEKLAGRVSAIIRRYATTSGGEFSYSDTAALVDIADAALDSGVIVRKYRAVNSTVYTRVEIEAFARIPAFASWYPVGGQPIGWAPSQVDVTIAGVAGAMLELGGAGYVLLPAIGAKASLFVQTTDSAGSIAVDTIGRREFAGNLRQHDVIGGKLLTDFEGANYSFLEDTVVTSELPTALLGYDDVNPTDKVYIRYKAVIDNPAMTTLPRFK